MPCSTLGLWLGDSHSPPAILNPPEHRAHRSAPGTGCTECPAHRGDGPAGVDGEGISPPQRMEHLSLGDALQCAEGPGVGLGCRVVLCPYLTEVKDKSLSGEEVSLLWSSPTEQIPS